MVNKLKCVLEITGNEYVLYNQCSQGKDLKMVSGQTETSIAF